MKKTDPNGDHSEVVGFLQKAQEMVQSTPPPSSIITNKKTSNSSTNNVVSSLSSSSLSSSIQSNNNATVKELRDELNRLMSQAQTCMIKHDYASAERFYQDSKRLCKKSQCEDYQGLGIVALQLSQIFILEADQASLEKQVVKYEKKLMYAMKEIEEGYQSISFVLKEAYDNISSLNGWTKQEVRQDKRVDFLSRMLLIKVLLHFYFILYVFYYY